MSSARPPDTSDLATYFALSRRHQLFVDAYVKTGVGAQAMRDIGFKGTRPQIAASKLLARPEVRAAVEARTAQAIAESGLNSKRILDEIRRIALFDSRTLFDANGEPIAPEDWSPEVAAAVLGFEIEDRTERNSSGDITRYRVKKFRLNSKNEALKMAAAYLKLWSERTEVTGKDGVPLAPPVINIGFANGGPGRSNSGTEGP